MTSNQALHFKFLIVNAYHTMKRFTSKQRKHYRQKCICKACLPHSPIPFLIKVVDAKQNTYFNFCIILLDLLLI